MNIYTSDQILAMGDLYELQDTFCSSGIPFQYKLTEGEYGWLQFVKGKYSIAEWIEKNVSVENELNELILTFDCPESLSQALHDDCGHALKAVCLSDDTALQKLFFWLSHEIEETEVSDND